MSRYWYPNAVAKPIQPGANDPQIKPVMFILHRSATRGDSLYDWFNGPSGGIESHGYTRRSGFSEQYRAFNYEADAQSGGNSWLVNGVRLGAISWETEGTATDEWTAEQVAEIRRILTYVHDQFGIPLSVVDFANPPSLEKGGVGWHSKYALWNPSSHNCPGAANVTKLRALLTDMEDTVALTDDDVQKVAKATADMLLNTREDALRNDVRVPVEAELLEQRPEWVAAVADAVAAKIPQAAVDLDALADKVADKLAARLSS